MSKRKAISKKIRFEVFKRDSFICQYCGHSAPEIILEIDHIKPVCRGGTNDITNLITSCKDCNRGKSGNELSDNTVITKQKKQLDLLNERRKQLTMLMEWHTELDNIEETQITYLQDIWERETDNFSWNESGLNNIKKLLRKYGFEEVLKAIKTAAVQYLKRNEDGDITIESVEYAFNKIAGICRVNASGGFSEDMKQMYYIRGILRKRGYCNDWQCMSLMKQAVELNVNLESIETLAKSCRNWTEWRSALENYIEDKR